jgi:hypothetical protein
VEYRFDKHYSLDEARALLPEIRKWLEQASRLRRDLEKLDERLSSLMGVGADLGGKMVNDWARKIAEFKSVLLEFHRREIQIKDLSRGLIDFPAIIGGREVFLCWEQDEEDIEYWHDLDTGYAGREKLSGSE